MVKLLCGEIEKADLLRKIGRIEQIAGARPVKLASGKAEGIKAWEIYNGSGLEFCVMESQEQLRRSILMFMVWNLAVTFMVECCIRVALAILDKAVWMRTPNTTGMEEYLRRLLKILE